MDKLNLVKLGNSGLVLGSCKFSLLPQLSQKNEEVVKRDSKIIVSLRLSKSATHSAVRKSHSLSESNLVLFRSLHNDNKHEIKKKWCYHKTF